MTTTTDEGREKLFSKLRKILALTTSPMEGEAAAAAGHLQRLLTEHNLSMADLEQRGQKSPGVRKESHDLGKAAFKWKLDLAEGIAEFYYCVPLVNRWGRYKHVAFIGRPENVESLQMLYEWLMDQIKAIAREERRKHFDTTGEHIDPLRWQVSFGEGVVERLIVRLKELKARQAEDMSRDEYGNVTALALHHASEIGDFMEEQFGWRKDGKLTKRQQEREDQRRREAEAKDEMKIRCEQAGDMEPYYELYPEDRPETEEQAAEREKEWQERLKREEKNVKRRKGNDRPGPAVDWDKEDQQDKARESGRSSAERVNLQPFLGGATDRKKVG